MQLKKFLHRFFEKLGIASSIGVLIIGQHTSAASLYTDRSLFDAATDPGTLVVEDFEDTPLNGSGFAAVSNGAVFPGFSLISTSITSDIDLTNGVPATDTGLDGTFLLRDTSGDILVLPGGGGGSNAGHVSDDDDFRITFDQPTTAAGLGLIENNVGPGNGDGSEWVRFLDQDNNVILQTTLPLSATLDEKFVGLIIADGDPMIAAIEVNEGNILDDDIAFDDVTFALSTLNIPVLGTHFQLILFTAFAISVAKFQYRHPKG